MRPPSFAICKAVGGTINLVSASSSDSVHSDFIFSKLVSLTKGPNPRTPLPISGTCSVFIK